MPKIPAVDIPDPPAGPIEPTLVSGYDPLLGTNPVDQRYTLTVYYREDIEFSGPRPWVLFIEGGNFGPGTGQPARTLEDVCASDPATNQLARLIWERGIAVVSMGYTIPDASITGGGAFDPGAWLRQGTIPESVLQNDLTKQGVRMAERDIVNAIQYIRWTGVGGVLDQDQDTSGGIVGVGTGAMVGAWCALGFSRGPQQATPNQLESTKTRVPWFVAHNLPASWNAWVDAVELPHLTDGAGGTALTVGAAKAVADGPDNQNIRDASPLWYGFNFPQIRSRNAQLPVFLTAAGTATYGGPYDYASFDGVLTEVLAVESLTAIREACIGVATEFGNLTHQDISRFEINPVGDAAQQAATRFGWILERIGLDALPESSAEYYAPDYPLETYAPPGVIPTPWEFLTVFLPDSKVHQRPPSGWPAYVATGYGGFASTGPTLQIFDFPSDSVRTPWEALEAGIAVITVGLPGTDSARYTPTGDKYGEPVSLGSIIPGNGTWDPPGEETAGFDHFDDVGSSVDGGVSYPRQNFPIAEKCAVLAIQYIKSRAKAWGIDSRLLATFGRSAGSIAMSYPAFGPDRADPAMNDHRAESSRVPLVVQQLGWCWIPAMIASSGTFQMFPNPGNPDAVAATLAAAPPGYAQEASALRYGFRNYLAEGPAISGAALRKLNGQTAVFLAAGFQGLGLNGSTPTEAMEFVGSDAADNRLPALVNEIPDLSHPAIQPLLLRYRLLEVDDSGVQATHSRLVMVQSDFDQLAGHVDAAGNPLQDLVTDVREDVTDADGTIASVIVTWLLAQFERLRTELGIDDSPIPVQAQHERTDVRNAVAQALLGKTLAGERVYASRVRPYLESELPCIAVFTEDEQWNLVAEAPREYEVTADLRIIAIVRGADGYEAQLDRLTLEIERVIEADETISGTANRTLLSRTEIEADADGNQVIAKRSLVYQVSYLVEIPRPGDGSALDHFEKLAGPIETAEGAAIELYTTPEQL